MKYKNLKKSIVVLQRGRREGPFDENAFLKFFFSTFTASRLGPSITFARHFPVTARLRQRSIHPIRPRRLGSPLKTKKHTFFYFVRHNALSLRVVVSVIAQHRRTNEHGDHVTNRRRPTASSGS